MKRRRLVALVSATILLSLGMIAVAAGALLTGTSAGQDQIRRLVYAQLAGKVKGTLYIGRISGTWLTGVTVDSVAIRDAADSLFLSATEVTVAYDPRDLIDRRILVKGMSVERPHLNLTQLPDGSWNYQHIFPPSTGPRGPRAPGRHFGDYVVLDSVRVRNGSFTLAMPWAPDGELRGAQRDSAIRVALADTMLVTRPTKDGGFERVYRWRRANVFLPHIRLADPDSNRFGRAFRFERASVEESYPPFAFRNARGDVRILAESLWADVPHFELPGSRGSGIAKVVWGSDLPTRYDLAIRADTVSLADVAWVYPTLPTTGGGRMNFRMRNDPNDLHVMTYALSDMDVRTTKSRLLGAMTFAVGGRMLEVRDVAMQADPIDWDLLRVLSGEPFPVDWQGRIIGTVRGPGGPLDRFVITDAQATFHDAHVPGAVSRFSGRGELDIFEPAFTKFRGFTVDVASLDMRSIQFLYPAFPALGGTISGTALLDSSWLDVRFSRADVTHRNGPGEPSRLTGAGRVTYGDDFMVYDVDVQALPLSLDQMTRAYPVLAAHGTLSGPIRAKGTVADLQLYTNLQGAAGAVSFDGTLDVYEPSFVANGVGEFSNFDFSKILDSAAALPTALSGRYTVNVSGDSAANLTGGVGLTLLRSQLRDIRVHSTRAAVRFAAGRMHLDTLRLQSTAGSLLGAGALGLPGGPSDSLRLEATIDSLGGLRAYVLEAGATDSLAGTLTVHARLRGRVDSLDANGTLAGDELVRGTTRVARALATFSLADLLRTPSGLVSFRADTVALGGVMVDTLGGAVRLRGRDGMTVAVGATTAIGVKVAAFADVRGNARAGSVELQNVEIDTDSSSWRLRAPSRVTFDSLRWAVDQLALDNGRGGGIEARFDVPRDGFSGGVLTVTRLPLSDVGELLQLPERLGGLADVNVRLGGTRTEPTLDMSARLDSVRYASMIVERLGAQGRYSDRNLTAELGLIRRGATAIRAQLRLPVDFTLAGGRLLDDSLSGTLTADGADFSVLEAFTPALRQSSGRFSANLAVGGTWRRPTIGGRVAVNEAETRIATAGIRLRGINAELDLIPGRDSLVIRRASAWSGRGPGDGMSILGWVSFRDRTDPSFAITLSARNFNAFDRRGLGQMTVSTATDPVTRLEGIRLTGRLTESTVSGTLNIDRGTAFLPDQDLAGKQVIDLSSADLADLAAEDARALIPEPPSEFVEGVRLEGLRVMLGDDVWLRSREANVKLSGSLSVTSAEDELAAARCTPGEDDRTRRNGDACRPVYRLALEGTLNADRGVYRLDLGVVQREFRVQRGAIVFGGTADNNPDIDITALHTVKRPGQQDLGVQVRIHGRLEPYPTLDFASTENYEISQSDLVSYLVTGRPSFENTEDIASTVASVLLPSASALLSDQLRGWTGGADIQLQGGATSGFRFNREGAQQAFGNAFYGTRAGVEREVWGVPNLYANVTAGFCAFKDKQFLSNASAYTDFGSQLVQSIGLKLDYRFNPLTSLQAGIEPSVSQASCGEGAATTVGGVYRQLGVSLFRTWRF